MENKTRNAHACHQEILIHFLVVAPLQLSCRLIAVDSVALYCCRIDVTRQPEQTDCSRMAQERTFYLTMNLSHAKEQESVLLYYG